MKRIFTLLIVLSCFQVYSQTDGKIKTRQGQVSFFSYTSVENIEATNNQVLSGIDLSNGEIAVSMLMKAFIFKKALMEEHFNESYVESDIYPKSQFQGTIKDFDPTSDEVQTRIVQGTFNFHGVQKELEIKVKIDQSTGTCVVSGDFDVEISDYDIKVPPLLVPNIAKTIKITFRFEYDPS